MFTNQKYFIYMYQQDLKLNKSWYAIKLNQTKSYIFNTYEWKVFGFK